MADTRTKLKRRVKRKVMRKVLAVYGMLDKLYAKHLEKKNGAEPIPREDFDRIRAIHNQAFPSLPDYTPYEQFLQINRCFSYAQLHYKIIGETYAVWSEHLGLIIANNMGTTGDFGFGMAAYIMSIFKSCNHKLIWGYFRDSTTYPMVMKMKNKNMIRIYRDKKVYSDVGHDLYHSMILKNRKPLNERLKKLKKRFPFVENLTGICTKHT